MPLTSILTFLVQLSVLYSYNTKSSKENKLETIRPKPVQSKFTFVIFSQIKIEVIPTYPTIFKFKQYKNASIANHRLFPKICRMHSRNRRKWTRLHSLYQILPSRRSARQRDVYSVSRQHLRFRRIHLRR